MIGGYDRRMWSMSFCLHVVRSCRERLSSPKLMWRLKIINFIYRLYYTQVVHGIFMLKPVHNIDIGNCFHYIFTPMWVSASYGCANVGKGFWKSGTLLWGLCCSNHVIVAKAMQNWLYKPWWKLCGEWGTQAEILAAPTILKIQIFVFTCKPWSQEYHWLCYKPLGRGYSVSKCPTSVRKLWKLTSPSNYHNELMHSFQNHSDRVAFLDLTCTSMEKAPHLSDTWFYYSLNS